MAKPKGRPTVYSEKKVKEILELVSEGIALWKIVCRVDMPSRTTFYDWMLENPDLRDKYETAKNLATDKFAEEIIDIADDDSGDYIEAADGRIVINTNKVRRDELKIKARQWMASKIQPKKYGDRIQQEITQPEGVTFNMNFGDKKKEN